MQCWNYFILFSNGIPLRFQMVLVFQVGQLEGSPSQHIPHILMRWFIRKQEHFKGFGSWQRIMIKVKVPKWLQPRKKLSSFRSRKAYVVSIYNIYRVSFWYQTTGRRALKRVLVRDRKSCEWIGGSFVQEEKKNWWMIRKLYNDNLFSNKLKNVITRSIWFALNTNFDQWNTCNEIPFINILTFAIRNNVAKCSSTLDVHETKIRNN